ncbi:extracellular matrix regulator RemB [Evansella sp. AB-rgal1]|uniref:extracellular matrix regulator RemB n=1 Tax=Evansella sp. AB-rgal1 TaxID=3242696 RepID=UPI00359EFC73
MFIHLGGDVVLRSHKVVAILDYHSKETSQDNERFIELCEKNSKTVSISTDNPKSIVITENEVYLSPISSHTLKRRAETVAVLEEE